jgi:amino acid transporter
VVTHLKDLLLGPPLPSNQASEKRLSKFLALAAFSPDALSSIAYANQEIFLGLVIAGTTGLAFAWPIGIAITILLVMVALSYFQTIQCYPSGGGSYIVAKENLSRNAGLTAAAALSIGYLLTAAVSLTAGVEALASALPVLWPLRVQIALGLLLVITIANLRGARESGMVMAIPVYFFLFTYLPMLAYGLYLLVTGGPTIPVVNVNPTSQPVSIYLLLHTFATGCTALTGIEAISNGVPAFKPPQTKNAGKTLIIMAILMAVLFIGSIGLTQALGVVAGPEETILSALARRLVGSGAAYFIVQISTTLILAVAANTSFSGFPRLAAILAKDGFLPHQLTSLGDRLVFTNGIALLSFATAVLMIVFGGESHALIPLFAVGVFMAFTLSQAGMVVHWSKERSRGWWIKLAINGIGALATGATMLIVGLTKFLEGAWITVLLIPLIVVVFQKIRSHYQEVGKELSLHGLPPSLKPELTPRIVLPISGVHRGIVEAVNYARSITDNVTAVYVSIEPEATQFVENEWHHLWPDIPLIVVPSPYRSIITPILDFLDRTDKEHHDGRLATVILPEFVPAKWWHGFLHNQTAWLLRAALLYRRRRLGYHRVVIDIPFYLKK